MAESPGGGLVTIRFVPGHITFPRRERMTCFRPA